MYMYMYKDRKYLLYNTHTHILITLNKHNQQEVVNYVNYKPVWREK